MITITEPVHEVFLDFILLKPKNMPKIIDNIIIATMKELSILGSDAAGIGA